jgi:oligopeptide transport system substrate-binding protein
LDHQHDKLTYTFTLREGLKWSGRTDLTAEDFVYAWNRAISPDTAADYEYMFDVIDGYDEVSERDRVGRQDPAGGAQGSHPLFLELTAFPPTAPYRRPPSKRTATSGPFPQTYVGNARISFQVGGVLLT